MADIDIQNPRTRVAARGTVQLMLGRMFFMVGGYVIAVVLARGLGPAAYGIYGLLMSMLLWLEVTSAFGMQHATIKLVAESKNQRAVAQTSAAALLTVTLAVFALCWLAAPIVALTFDIDGGTRLFRIAVLDIPFNGLYIAYQGMMQGHRRFGTVSVTFILYSVTKLGGILLLLIIGMSVEAALIVNVLATVAALIFLVSIYRPGIKFESIAAIKKLVCVALPFGVFVMTNRFVLSSHLWSLKWFADESEETIGYYAAAWNIAQLPTVVTFVLTGVILASISAALARNDVNLAHTYIQAAGRFLLVTLLPMCVLGAMDATPIMEFIFSSTFSTGGHYLAVLLCAYGVSAILDTMMHGMLAAGEYSKVSLVQIFLMPIALLLNWLLISRFGGDGAALSLLATLMLGSTVAVLWTTRKYGFPIKVATLIRVTLATTVAAGLSSIWQADGFEIVFKLATLVILYASLLIVLRELGPDDMQPLAVWKSA